MKKRRHLLALVLALALCAGCHDTSQEGQTETNDLGGTGEIGFFTTRIPGLNAVSLTPNAFNCHSTQEYLSIRECRYFYNKMAELLEKMKDM